MLLSLILATAIVCPAQKNKAEQKLFEEAATRDQEPAFQVFITPQVADVEFLSEERETFGPYQFRFKGELTQGGLENFKGRAVYNAMIEAGADVIIAMLPHSYISENDDHVLYVEITGYPAKYVKFRPLGKNPDDFEMIRTVYPDAFGSTRVYTKTVKEAKPNATKTETK